MSRTWLECNVEAVRRGESVLVDDLAAAQLVAKAAGGAGITEVRATQWFGPPDACPGDLLGYNVAAY